jgi:hypothetical protein
MDFIHRASTFIAVMLIRLILCADVFRHSHNYALDCIIVLQLSILFVWFFRQTKEQTDNLHRISTSHTSVSSPLLEMQKCMNFLCPISLAWLEMLLNLWHVVLTPEIWKDLALLCGESSMECLDHRNVIINLVMTIEYSCSWMKDMYFPYTHSLHSMFCDRFVGSSKVHSPESVM